MAKFDLKRKAYKMRRGGAGLSEIASTLSVSKSTASIWCRDLVLTKKQSDRLKQKQIAAGHAGRMAGALKNKLEKEKRQDDAKKRALRRIKKLSKRDCFILGLGLYWGEGVKADQSPASFVNSDPASVVFMKQWFQEFFAVSEEQFNPYIFVTDIHKSREREIRRFWAQLLNLPLEEIKHIVYIKTVNKKVYENHDLYYGTLALRVKKSSHIKYDILALIERIKPT